MSRYIDADALKEKIGNTAFLKLDDTEVVEQFIDTAPSIDIEPKRGEWIDDDFVGQYRCSECDYYAIDEYDYCPNCGARMKGADDE